MLRHRIGARVGQTVGMTVMRTARERARTDIVTAIKAEAARQLALVGAPGLSLRAVSRELGLASSALYRYFPSRDALLTALIVDAFDAVGEAAEQAEGRALADGADPGRRWLEVCRAVRRWAVEHPHSYALVYGSPVPGYAAPRDTVAPAIRVSRVMAGILEAAAADGSLRVPERQLSRRLVTADVAAVLEQPLPEQYADGLERSLTLLSGLFGAISWQLFGHFHGALEDPDAWFDFAVAVAAEGVGLVVPIESG
jgi:AcrR family transcriptional regulator